MNQNQTESKPDTVEQLPDEGLDETACSASVFLHLPVTEGVIQAALEAFSRGELTATQVQNLALGWLPISTAPKDGTVILTDAGSCAWVSAEGGVSEGWYLCAPGESPATGDEFWASRPTHWKKYPSLPNVRSVARREETSTGESDS